MSNRQSFTLSVQQAAGSDDTFIEFPKEFLDEQDWREGDNISWTPSELGGFVLRNLSKESRKGAEELPLFEVETIVSHRVRYAVRARSAEEAAAAVADEGTDADEFDQNCLGKKVASARQITQEQYLADPGHMGSTAHALSLIHNADPKA